MSRSHPQTVNLKSVDAMFAQVIANQKAQSNELAEIKAHVMKTNGRVTKLEE
ncbi:MAG: hypothetical protein LBK99_21285 [Opitutaceae bacterium]|jgi:hypothetical protein|nr:hypothetical protein [Opitutaceae bacterium]